MQIKMEWYVENNKPLKTDVIKNRHVVVTIAYPVKAPTTKAPVLAYAMCPFCHETNIKPMTKGQLRELKSWNYQASQCLDFSPSLRELFISGICDRCWPDEPDE